jgi:hypothetical protein
VRFLRGEKPKGLCLLPHSLAEFGLGFENDFAFFYQIKEIRFPSFLKNDLTGFELCGHSRPEERVDHELVHLRRDVRLCVAIGSAAISDRILYHEAA